MRELPVEIHNGGMFLLSKENFTPSYIESYQKGILQQRVDELLKRLDNCQLCPRKCRVNRLRGERKYCGIGRFAKVASFSRHLGEEDVIRGDKGSGTIFFSGCNLKCVFCQNYDISLSEEGLECNADELAEMMLKLQQVGCHNINFVTPTHVVPQILEALLIAVKGGLRLPLVYNTGGYDDVDVIRLLDGIVDIYMPDLKMWHQQNGRRYLRASDYRDIACEAILEMHRQVGELKCDEEGFAIRGLLVRLLVMPGMLEDTRETMAFLARKISTETYVNILDQYYPSSKVPSNREYQEIDRCISPHELKQAYRCAQKVGLWRFDSRWL